MKTLVILSDTHRNLQPLEKIATVLAESDYIIHLGDMASDANDLLRAYPKKTFIVSGNNDFFGGLPNELVLDVEGRRLFACHGHRYGVKSGTERLAEAAKEHGCDIALYGHTHAADVHEEKGILLINPGCMTRYSPEKSYCYLLIEKQKAVATIVNIR